MNYQPKTKMDHQVNLTYQDGAGKSHSQDYELNYDFHPEEQFESSDCLREAISGYVFTSELKSILKNCTKM